jgi:hypothetical protein
LNGASPFTGATFTYTGHAIVWDQVGTLITTGAIRWTGFGTGAAGIQLDRTGVWEIGYSIQCTSVPSGKSLRVFCKLDSNSTAGVGTFIDQSIAVGNRVTTAAAGVSASKATKSFLVYIPSGAILQTFISLDGAASATPNTKIVPTGTDFYALWIG